MGVEFEILGIVGFILGIVNLIIIIKIIKDRHNK
jgi:hypothetical protein